MTATNHVVTGAIVGTIITNPLLALPLAFLLHFVLDALPHFGLPFDQHTTRRFKIIILSDVTLALAFLLSICVMRPENWVLLIACAVACASPDLVWLPRWLNELRGKKNPPLGKIVAFHSRIQWGERSWGWIIEIAWFVAAYSVFLTRTAP